MRKPFLLVALFLTMNMSLAQKQPYQNQELTIEERVDNLLSLMTLKEKVGQTILFSGNKEMTGPSPMGGNKEKVENVKKGLVGGVLNVVSADQTLKMQKLAVENSRLGIPLIFGYDIIHGYQTMFPIPLAQAASWDIDVARKSAEYAAKEGTAAGLNWTYAPMIDISRDGRWGRMMESPGEDPYLASVMAKGWVEGFQGDDLSSNQTLAACAKHFAAYGFAEAGRDYNTVDISKSTLLNVVLPPFKAAKDAGVATFMNAFNDINGIPATGHEFLQRSMLKGKWGFKGFVVSDWASISEMFTHGYAVDTAHAGQLALKAGSDMDMEGRAYEKTLEQSILDGKVNEELLDDAVKRILRVKFQLGLFDNPYKYANAKNEQRELLSKSNLNASREVARETFVLLKNEEDILPLKKEVSSIAVIGQLADNKDTPLGSWRAQAVTNSAVSILEGLENAVSKKTKVRYAPGYNLTSSIGEFRKELDFVENDTSGFSEAIKLAKSSDLVIMVLGENCFQTGEGRSQVDTELKGNQNELIEEVYKVNQNVIVVLMTGRAVPLVSVADNSKAILQTWFAGSEAGYAVSDVLFGDYAPSGKLPVSFPYYTGQEPIYYSRKNTGRPTGGSMVFWSHYVDSPNEPLYPFGFGLTYTKFEFTDFDVAINKDGIRASVRVQNVGSRSGKEVVQLYIRDVAASVIRPIKELKRIKKVTLEAGSSITIEFQLTKQDLSFYTNEGEYLFEPGEFEIMIGSNSKELQSRNIVF